MSALLLATWALLGADADKNWKLEHPHFELIGTNADGSKYALRLHAGCGDSEGETEKAASECGYPRVGGKCNDGVALLVCALKGGCTRHVVYGRAACSPEAEARDNLAKAKAAIAAEGISLEAPTVIPIATGKDEVPRAALPSAAFAAAGLDAPVTVTLATEAADEAFVVGSVVFEAPGFGPHPAVRGTPCFQLCGSSLKAVWLSANKKLVFVHANLTGGDYPLAATVAELAAQLKKNKKKP